MKFYRYIDYPFWHEIRIEERIFDLIKETPKGYWIESSYFPIKKGG